MGIHLGGHAIKRHFAAPIKSPQSTSDHPPEGAHLWVRTQVQGLRGLCVSTARLHCSSPLLVREQASVLRHRVSRYDVEFTQIYTPVKTSIQTGFETASRKGSI